MPNTEEIVINTSPTIGLVAALGNLDVLQIYKRGLVPGEVADELLVEKNGRFAATEFEAASWLDKQEHYQSIPLHLKNSLDIGEAGVIQCPLSNEIATVCIDETTGRRFARLNGLNVTGSIGILLRAKREGYNISMQDAIDRMQSHSIWLSRNIIQIALSQAGE